MWTKGPMSETRPVNGSKDKVCSTEKDAACAQDFFPGTNSLFYLCHAECLYISLLSTG